MHIDIITLFPEMVLNLAKFGVIGRAIETKLVSLNVINPRDFSTDPHRRVDDRPYGGGPGMVCNLNLCKKLFKRLRKRQVKVV